MADTGTVLAPIAGPSTPYAGESAFKNIDGFDLTISQVFLQNTMQTIQTDIQNIEQNANLSDTEKMFSMQMALNTWSAVATLRTNMLKMFGDTLKAGYQSIGS